MVMGSRALRACLLGFLVICGATGFHRLSCAGEFIITWDDMKVNDTPTDDDHRGLELNEDGSNRSGRRIIVVDQSGGGDSLTVQAAIDMVPEHNSQRVKVYILPGIYRSGRFFHLDLDLDLISIIDNDDICAGRKCTFRRLSH